MATGRTERDLSRGRRAAECVDIRGGSAITAACSYVEATFSPAIYHSIFKDRITTLIRRSAGHPEVWRRYQTLVERYQTGNLDAAIVFVDRARRAELEARTIAVRDWGHCSRSRLTLIMLDEVRLLLRMLRRHAPTYFTELLTEIRAADLTTSAWAGNTADAAE